MAGMVWDGLGWPGMAWDGLDPNQMRIYRDLMGLAMGIITGLGGGGMAICYTVQWTLYTVWEHPRADTQKPKCLGHNGFGFFWVFGF